MMQVLVIEDGSEYTETLERFLTEGFSFTRAGSGRGALALLAARPFDVVFLDMRFDRAPEGELLGDLELVADRFNGDPVQARRFLEDHQGNFILAELRGAGLTVPVLMSYDFSAEPRRWERLAERYGPVDYLDDVASPAEVAERLRALASGG
ncbi:MAG TPA: response regulator [Deltaproteobacteria bacterium]|nr:response regulator [Deltaproteobacteria bacterium]